MLKFYDCGIDLGTTNSAIAYPTDDNKCQIVDNIADRMNVTPSAVAYVRGRYLIGRRALDYPKVITCFKRKMGTKDTYSFEGSNVMVTPEQLSAEVLKSLKRDAESRLGKDVKDVVITVPAAFSSLQNEATKNAADMAGFRNVVLLQEPISAAIAYGVKPGTKNQYWMVFDYGGGTLDVSILSTHDGRLTVVNSDGDNFRGGSDIDGLIYDKLVKPKLAKEYNVEGNIELEHRLKKTCEACKIELSSSQESYLEIFDVEDNDGVAVEFSCTITRAEFEDLIKDTVEQCMEIAKNALSGAVRFDPNCKIDKILLVGGSTFIPLVRKRLSETFNVELDCSLNPMTVVAESAAIYGGSCSLDVEETKDVSVGSLEVALQYEPVTASDMVNVVGSFKNIGNISLDRVKIDLVNSSNNSGSAWTSGWVDFVDAEEGIFDIDLKICFLNENNRFVVHVVDKTGKEIPIENASFVIKHNADSLKLSAPPATFSVCVLVTDGENNILSPLIAKNTPLPAEATRTFHTTKELSPNKEDSIDIHVYEGELFDNPEANNWIGCIHIKSSAMRFPVPANTDIEITIRQDESRTNHVTGYIPSVDYVIPEETLRDKDERVSYEDKMEKIDKQFDQLDVSLKKLKDNDVDVADLEQQLDALRDEFDEVSDYIDVDTDKVQFFIKRFYDVHTAIITKERNFERAHSKQNAETELKQFATNISRFGSSDDKRQFDRLKSSYETERNEENKKFIYKQIEDLNFDVISNSFDFLSNIGGKLVADESFVYTDAQKANYWKNQAVVAYRSNNTEQLRKAVFKLLELLEDSANGSIGFVAADLKL